MDWFSLLGVMLLLVNNSSPQEQYKQLTRDALAELVDGNIQKAIDHFEDYLNDHPADLESLYGMAICYSRLNDIDEAIMYLHRAVFLGLPIERFLAGPRPLLDPLIQSRQFQTIMRQLPIQLVHGPLLGCVTDHSARFWFRTFQEADLQVVVSHPTDPMESWRSPTVRTDKQKDYTAILNVGDLKPDTEYMYRLIIDGETYPETWSFRTFPPRNKNAKFKIGFGGGAGYTPQHERMWNTIHSHSLPAFLFLGDNVYIDNPEKPDIQRYCYYRRQSRPEFRSFTSSSSIFAVWDDHDFTDNDAGGGPAIDLPPWKIPVWKLFQENWNNPSYGGGEKNPGCWFEFSIANVDFFMLDGRYYRDDPKTPNPSMLGDVQKRWLHDRLTNSNAVFKVIVSPVPWADGAKPGSLDPWQGYKEEREEIFSWIRENKIDGVILLSADRHRSDAWKIEREGCYPLYEFESSRLTNIHTHAIMPGCIFGYNESCSFGLLAFDTVKANPTVSYEIYNIDNELIHKITLDKRRLSFSN